MHNVSQYYVLSVLWMIFSDLLTGCIMHEAAGRKGGTGRRRKNVNAPPWACFKDLDPLVGHLTSKNHFGICGSAQMIGKLTSSGPKDLGVGWIPCSKPLEGNGKWFGTPFIETCGPLDENFSSPFAQLEIPHMSYLSRSLHIPVSVIFKVTGFFTALLPHSCRP